MRSDSDGESTNLIGEFSFEDTSMIPSYILNKSNLYKILSDVRKVSWDVEGKEVYRLITIDKSCYQKTNSVMTTFERRSF